MTKPSQEGIRGQIVEILVSNDMCVSIADDKDGVADQILTLLSKQCEPKMGEGIDIESICDKVHQAYCKYHLENKGTEYWTKGDYSKLNEEGKEYDRRTVRAVIDALAGKISKPQVYCLCGSKDNQHKGNNVCWYCHLPFKPLEGKKECICNSCKEVCKATHHRESCPLYNPTQKPIELLKGDWVTDNQAISKLCAKVDELIRAWNERNR